jgi:hypothetical protein
MLLRVQQTLVTVQQIVRKAACAGHRSFSVLATWEKPGRETKKQSRKTSDDKKNPTFTPRNLEPSEGKSRN